VRKIDSNFLRYYNQDPKKVRVQIDCGRDTIVMGEWYRRVIAVSETTKRDDKTGTALLIVEKARIPLWGSLRAACHHPDPVERLGTRLGLLGAWLGVVSVWLGLVSACGVSGVALLLGFGVIGLLGVVGLWAGWGPPRPSIA
jgi:hypothetical protein